MVEFEEKKSLRRWWVKMPKDEKRCHPRTEDREIGPAVKKEHLAIFYNYLGLWLQR